MPGHDLVLSEFILVELREKVLIKFGFPISIVALALARLKQSARIAEPMALPPRISRDLDCRSGCRTLNTFCETKSR